MAAPSASSCVVLVPSRRVYDTGCEEALAELSRRGLSVWRVRDYDPPPDTPDRMAADALAAGYDELLLIHPDIVFEPDDVQRLQALKLPIACGVNPLVAAKSFACGFLPGTASVRFGRGGGPTEVAASGVGFALIRREVFDALRATLTPTPEGIAPYFSSDTEDDRHNARPVSAGDSAFCRRARESGFKVIADTSGSGTSAYSATAGRTWTATANGTTSTFYVRLTHPK